MSEVIPPPIDAAVDVESPMAIVRTIIIEIKVQTHLFEIKLAVPNDMANAPPDATLYHMKHNNQSSWPRPRKFRRRTCISARDERPAGALFPNRRAHEVVPMLRPGDVVVMDYLGNHKGQAVRQAIRSVGANLLFLPP